jgi:hypothetical protein
MTPTLVDRRGFLKLGGLLVLGASGSRMTPAFAQAQPPGIRAADHTIEIAKGLAEIGPAQIISTMLY